VASTYSKTVGDKTTIVSKELHSRQVWMSTDGKDGWLIEAGEEDITLAGSTPLTGAYDSLVKLPTDPDVLLKQIYKESDAVRDPEVPRDQAAFVAIGDLLNESYPPADVAVALYKAAAKIPGVVAVDDAVDALGRHGVAIARQNDTDGQRTEWIFDKKTLQLLGDRTVQVKAEKDRISSEAKAAKDKCKDMKGNAKDICMAEAKGNEKIAKAELELKQKDTPKNRYDVAVAKADMEYHVAKEKCDDMKGKDKKACEKDAKAAHDQAKKQAKAEYDKEKADIKSKYAKADSKRNRTAGTGSTTTR